MPIAHINIMEGRTDEQKEMLVAEVTAAISRSIDAPEQNIRVLIHEVPKQNWGIGGTSAKKLGR
ncbi:2-hydroxymuconate tautomerase [Marinobacterium arenosum]|uniref:2-hydroxymuconate tautomerase n=1 Tax=Marinobacterium arenosum TaxID=2862496 RepID=UPI001C95A7E4|nr:2-hydroxymuconate tautomerase [Marinobacterium arenosum]MBY4676692.1 4-oxalocrotonate tautomerase family protein [Marinobacterium arenosum]